MSTNWPLIDEAVNLCAGPNDAYSPNTINNTWFWVSIVGRSINQFACDRGRDYELDQVQSGTASVTIQDTDGAFDAAAGFANSPRLYRMYRRRAQNPGTINLLTRDQATAGLAGGLVAGVLPDYVTGNSNWSGAQSVTTDGAGNYVTSLTTSASQQTIVCLGGVGIVPGSTYTVSCTVKSSVSQRFQFIGVAHNRDNGEAGSGSSFTTIGTTPTRISWSIGIGSDAVGFRWHLASDSSGSTAATVTTSLWQVEKSNSVSSYVQPGQRFSLFTGFVERWLQSYERSGTYPQSELSMVDAFGWLSQRKLLSPFYMEAINIGSLNFFYALDQPDTTNLFTDLTGRRVSIPIFEAPADVGPQCASGGQLAQLSTTTPTAGGYLPQGIGGPVPVFTNALVQGQASGIDVTAGYVPDSSFSQQTAGPRVIGNWTRMIAFQTNTAYPNDANRGGMIWGAATTPGIGSYLYLQITGVGGVQQLQITVNNNGNIPTGGPTFNFGPTGINDGGWHIVALVCDAANRNILVYLDGTLQITLTSTAAIAPIFVGSCIDWIGAGWIQQTAIPSFGFVGNIACAIEWNTALTAAQVSLLYSTFHYGGSGLGTMTSATRYADILRWASWPGKSSIENFNSGQTVSYGPALELLAASGDSGTDALSALQTVVDTENGMHFVAADGTITFQARRHRYNANTLAATFGENTGGGELPYTEISFELDPTKLANDAQLTQTNTGLAVGYNDPTSITTYGDVQIQRSINSTDLNELKDAAQYLVTFSKTPVLRCVGMTTVPSNFTLSGTPSINEWTTMLGLEISTRVRAMRRAPSLSAYQFDGFIERIAWDMSDKGEAFCKLQISPINAIENAIGQISSLRMTLHNSVAVNATSATINPLSDAATNPIQADLPSGDGNYNAVIDWGTGSAEFITITPVAGATGYSTATLTIGSCMRADTGVTGTGFRFTHAINATIIHIGGLIGIPPFNTITPTSALATAITPYLSPANVLDSVAVLDSTLVLTY